MVEIKFYINNSQVEQPANLKGFCVELNYGKDQFANANVISISNFEWVKENYTWFMNYINSGLTGGFGIFEAPSLRIDLCNGSLVRNLYTGYIDLTANAAIKDKIKIIAKTSSHNSVDWLADKGSGFTFEFLTTLAAGSPGAIDNTNYRWIPYINNSVPNYEQAAIATLMVFNIEQAIVVAIKAIAKNAADAGGYFTTIPAIIKLILEIAYLLVLIITLAKLIKDMIKFIISPVKYHAGMYVRDLLSKGCEFLGKTFKCENFEIGSEFYDEFILPQKTSTAPNALDGTMLGFLLPNVNEQTGYFKGTFSTLLEAMKVKYCAKAIVTNDEIILIRKDKNAQPAQYQLPDIYVPDYTYNTDELQANTMIEFQLDQSETNTYRNYQGTIYQVICQPNVINNQAYVMMKNSVNVPIPFARASIKTALTTPEEIVRDFLVVFETITNVIVTVVNTIVGIVNDIIHLIKKIFKFVGLNLNIPDVPTMNKLNLSQVIENRIGMLVLSSDFFNVPKIFILVEGSESKYNKVHPNNDNLEHAKTHWDRFHYVNSFIPTQMNPLYEDRPAGNQYVKRPYPRFQFTWDDFIAVVTNNRIKDFAGNDAVIESLKFYPNSVNESGSAEGVFRFSQLYTLNLKETKILPSGS